MTSAFDLDQITLHKGGHHDPTQGHCLLEVVSMFAKEPFTDAPRCVSPYLRSFGISLNDNASDVQRQDLKRFIPLLPGTAGDGLDEKRRWIAADHVIRVSTPRSMDAAGLTDHAEGLRALPKIIDRVTWLAAQTTVRAARDAAYRARNDTLGGSLYDVVYRRVRAAVSEALSKNAAATAAATATAATAATAAATAATAAADAATAATATATAATAAADAATAATTDATTDATAATAAAAATAATAATAAAADAADAIPAYGSDAYWEWRRQLREAVYAKVRAVYEERYGDLLAESWQDALSLFERLITCGVA